VKPFRYRHRLVPAAAAVLFALLLNACGAQVAVRPLPPNPLLELVALNKFPVYWLGGSFDGLQLTEITRDSGGAISLQYGACLRGGQYECLAPLTVVTSPEDSFLPHGHNPLRERILRGVRAFATTSGRTYEIPTGSVVVSIYAQQSSLAGAAARSLATLNTATFPDSPLAAPSANGSYARLPLSGQMVRIVSPPRRAPRRLSRTIARARSGAGCRSARRSSCA
jgi:hypothetical protein